jgi:DNA polymerase
VEEIELVHRLLPSRDIDTLDSLLGNPMEAISSALRSFLVAAPGHRLLVGDFAQIEARAAAWIAGQTDLVEGFRNGEDVYKPMAAKIYDKPVPEVTKIERQLGKVAVLGCQYGLGAKGFQAAVKMRAGMAVDKSFAKRAVNAYRAANPRIKEIWGELNTACIRAIQTGKRHRVGRLEIIKAKKTLQIKLPSGRHLHFWYPELKRVRAPWSEGFFGSIRLPESELCKAEEWDIDLIEDLGDDWYECSVPKDAAKLIKQHGFDFKLELMEPKYLPQIQYMGVDSQRKKWCPIRTYGGMLFENVVQAIARDFLAESMLRLEKANYPIIGTVHDEVICELPNGSGSLEEFEGLLGEVPHWGDGCPIDVEVFESVRYRK